MDSILKDKYLRLLWQKSLVGMALVGSDGKFLEVNPMFCSLLGFTESELLNKTYQEITHPADLQFDNAMATKVLNGEIDEYVMIKRYVTKANHIVWMKLKVVRIENPETGQFELFFSQILPPIDSLYRDGEINLEISIPVRKPVKNFLRDNIQWVIAFLGGIGLVLAGSWLKDNNLRELGQLIILGSVGGYQFTRDTKPKSKV